MSLDKLEELLTDAGFDATAEWRIEPNYAAVSIPLPTLHRGLELQVTRVPTGGKSFFIDLLSPVKLIFIVR